MTSTRWTNIRLILNREVRDQFRDRRTLFMIAVLPLLLYPLMGISFMQLAQFLKKTPSKVLLVTEQSLPTDPPLLEDGKVAGVPEQDAALLTVDVQQNDLPSSQQAAAYAATIIEQGAYDVVVCLPAGFANQLSRGPLDVIPSDANSPVEPQMYYNAAKDKSRIAYERMSFVMKRWQRKATAKSVADRQSPARRVTAPFSLTTQDVAKPQGRQAAIWSKILPFVALVWALTGAFYPAVDLCAGEKERGTLETLLCSPAERSEIVLGKLLTIMIFSFMTSCLNLLCMTFTATFAIHQFDGMASGPTGQLVGAPPMASLGWLMLALVPIVALFSAVSLALATMARSTKEGQYYLMPLLLVSMPLMMLAMFPSAELDLGTSIIPITGVMLLLRNLMEGAYREALVYSLPVLGVTAACCLMAIRWAIDQFNDETVLFRSSERFSLRLWMRQMIRDRGPTPSFAAGLMCGVLILMIRFFAGLSLPTPGSWNSLALITAITLIAFVAAPAVLMAGLLTTEPRATLLLKRPTHWHALPAAALFALCLHPIAIALTAMVRLMYPIDVTVFAPFESILAGAPSFGMILLLMAVLPAICEEVAFRGFILSGLRQPGHKWRAIFITSVLFGMAHGVVQQSLLATVFGMVLGYLAIQTGSVLPCIAFHAVHNTLGLCFSQYVPRLLEVYPRLDVLIHRFQDGSYYYGPVVILAAFILSAGLLRWFRSLGYEPKEGREPTATLGQPESPMAAT